MGGCAGVHGAGGGGGGCRSRGPDRCQAELRGWQGEARLNTGGRARRPGTGALLNLFSLDDEEILKIFTTVTLQARIGCTGAGLQ